MSQPPGLSVLDLPQEVLSHILELLDAEDVVSASGVCRLWYRVTNGLVLSRRGEAVCRAGGDDVQVTGVSTLTVILDGWPIEGIVSGADVLHLRLRYDTGHRRLQDGLLARLLLACPAALSLGLSNVDLTPCNARTILQCQPPQLSRLSFTMRSATEYNHNAVRAILDCEVLFGEIQLTVGTTTTATYPNPGNPFRVPRTTRKVDASCAGLQDSAYRPLADTDFLEDVTLRCAYQLSSLGTQSLASLRNMTRLCVSDAPLVSRSSWQRLLASLNSLTTLRLDRCPQLCDASLRHVGAMPLLSELALDLEGCKLVSPGGLALALCGQLACLRLKLDWDPALLGSLHSAVERSDSLRAVEVTVQRVGHTSAHVTEQLSLVEARLESLKSQKGITGSFTETFTRIRLHLTQ